MKNRPARWAVFVLRLQFSCGEWLAITVAICSWTFPGGFCLYVYPFS